MKVYNENDFLMLSGIQHYTFCKRQWALIHIENQWEENIRTVDGRIMHKRAHDGPTLEKRSDKIISREMPVFSRNLGINGVCDVVEFIKTNDEREDTVTLFEEDGYWTIVPVEYKRGAPKENDADRLQVVAQAMCLEDMFCTKINKAFLYYGEIRKREEVVIDELLRKKVEDMCEEMHKLFVKKHTPLVKQTKACNACSMKNVCLPKLMKQKNVVEYVLKNLEDID